MLIFATIVRICIRRIVKVLDSYQPYAKMIAQNDYSVHKQHDFVQLFLAVCAKKSTFAADFAKGYRFLYIILWL